jgi:hypothetical protein
VLLELVLIRASALLSSQFRSTFYGRNAGQLSIPDEKPGLMPESLSRAKRQLTLG